MSVVIEINSACASLGACVLLGFIRKQCSNYRVVVRLGYSLALYIPVESAWRNEIKASWSRQTRRDVERDGPIF